MTAVCVWLTVKFHREPVSIANLAQLERRERIEFDVYKVVWNADGTRIAFVGWETPVDIRESVTLWKLATIGPGKKIIHFAFSPDENVVAYCENGTTAEILDRRTGQTKRLQAVNLQPSLAFSPNGKVLATGGSGDRARLWDVESGRLRAELFVGPIDGGLTPAFSPDGRLIAIGHRNSTTQLFDVSTGKPMHVLTRPASQELQFSPDGTKLAVAYVDASIGLWEVATGKLLHDTKTTAEEIYTLDWSPNGDILISAGLNGDINLWSGIDLRLLHSLPAPEWVISVRFRPDMGGVFSAGGSLRPGGNRFIQEWEVPSVLKRAFGTSPVDGR